MIIYSFPRGNMAAKPLFWLHSHWPSRRRSTPPLRLSLVAQLRRSLPPQLPQQLSPRFPLRCRLSLTSLPLHITPRSLMPVALIALFLLIVSLPLPARAFNLPEADADEEFNDKLTVDGKKFVDQVRKHLDTYNDYSVDSSVFMYKPRAQQVAGGNICFKKINLVKLTVRAKGLKDGSQVVRSADGKIKACGGPGMLFLKMNLTEDSRLLQVPNGYNAIKSDLGHLLLKLSDAVAAGNKVRVTSEPVNVPRLKQGFYVVQVFKPSAGGDEICEQIFVNQTDNLPVEWDLFKGGVRFSVAVFENFKGNIGLDDSNFQL